MISPTYHNTFTNEPKNNKMIKMLNKEKVYQQCKRKVSNIEKFVEDTNFEN